MRGAAGYGTLLDALRGITWTARRPTQGAASGTHKSRLRGVSPEFSEYRPYRQGDDPRRLDWRLLARTDRAYFRLTNDRATLATLVLVDGSASMAWPEASLGKWEHAKQLAVGLAAVAHAAGDPVAVAVVTGQGVRRTELRTRRGVITECARLLQSITPQGRVEIGVDTPVEPAARRIALVSDFLDVTSTVRAARAWLTAGCEVHAIHVVAPEELDPPATAMLATDPEQSTMRRALTPDTRTRYQEAFAAWRDSTARVWRQAGAMYEQTITDEQPARVVRRIAMAERDEARAATR